MAETLSAFNLESVGLDNIHHEQFAQYRWIVALAVIFAFLSAYGIGANDVANSFGTSVGSKAITLKQCILIASVFEFCGAFFLGASVTDTIKGKIAKNEAFIREPALLMFGMLCVELATGFWLILATYLELPVSTTHSVVGGIIGMAITLKGLDAVYWFVKIDSFPYIEGVVQIVISWLVSPVLAGTAAALLFFIVRTVVLRAPNSFDRSFYVLPVIVTLTVGVNLIFLMYKGGKAYGSADLPESTIQGAAWGTGAGLGLLTLACMPLLKKRVLNNLENKNKVVEPKTDKELEAEAEEEAKSSWFARAIKKNLDRDVHKTIEDDASTNDMHDRAEMFDPATEESFQYLQVFTACCASFAHGANDVANSIGPLAASVNIYNTSSVNSKAPVQKWVLAVGAVGIVIGLATYGYKIISAIGLKLTKITPTRGFSMELGASIIIVVGSNYGIPLSTTHCSVGAIVGVGLLDGTSGVNLMLFAKMIAGWVFTLVIVGGVAGLFVAVGVYAPSKPMSRDILAYQDGLRLRSELLNYAFNWEATAHGLDPATVLPPNNFNGTYSRRVVPDVDPNGVAFAAGLAPDAQYLQWKKSLWTDAAQWNKKTTWMSVWKEAIGSNVPADGKFKGSNTSSFHPEDIFNMYDQGLFPLALAPNQQALVQSVLDGDSILCCESQYVCCDRKCKYEKVNEDCLDLCEMMVEDGCVEEACDEPATKKATGDKCKILPKGASCPYEIAADSTKNYIGAAYVSAPITAAPTDVSTQSKVTAWREPNWVELGSLPMCPVVIVVK